MLRNEFVYMNQYFIENKNDPKNLMTSKVEKIYIPVNKII